MVCYDSATMNTKPKLINLRDANQQFSKLVREVEESGREYVVLRNGKPAARISPAADGEQRLSLDQQEAKARLMDPANHFTTPANWKFSREEIYDEAVMRHGVVRRLWLKEQKKGRKRG